MIIERMRNLFENDEGMTPIIGVVLLLAMTVVLGAVVAGVLGTMDTPELAPDVTLRLDDASTGSFTIMHMGGETINLKETNIYVDNVEVSTKKLDSEFKAGEKETIKATIEEDSEITIVDADSKRLMAVFEAHI